METLKAGIKEDPLRRWNLLGGIFFGHGACHILARHAADENHPRHPHRE